MKKKEKQLNKLIARVDMQVVILVFIFAFMAAVATSIIYWHFTFEVMMTSLEERAYAMYDTMELSFDKNSFYEIDNKEDMDNPLYQKSKDILLQMKNSAGMLYLYTAKQNEQGDLIYVIDGLEEDADFRNPGDLIEPEIVDNINTALNNVSIVPTEILHTNWGEVFVAYFPMHDLEGNVIGVVGMEFDASEVYNTYRHLIHMVPVIVVVLASLAAVASFSIFKRISNPLYKDMSTLDSPTGLKNRNSFDLDRHNLSSRNQMEGIGIVVVDLDGLKGVNDNLGHSAGDNYIRLVAKILKKKALDTMICYRVGGDEFAIIINNLTMKQITNYLEQCSQLVVNQEEYPDMKCSISHGACIYDKDIDKDLEDTYHRADQLMYQTKRMHKDQSV